MSNPFLEHYEPLDVIGNGSFGIIRKVRRKTDGAIFARKELNFERMTERDRKQIVAEVNILKDLHHDHIVRYHDRYVDRDAGILYILMEYCGGGDLSTIIKQAIKHDRPINEDLIWKYFMQLLLALQHCHHPNGHGRSGSGSSGQQGGGLDAEGKEKRPQILHRDLKPDNVFLDDNNLVKLGDFGLSKALGPASFANTYVGTPYYMSPELMQERAYDSKSDIWSLGCLIYELCALKPPFHEAKTHSELSGLIRNGRIPPLPKGYSQSLSSTIRAMLNLNPAMRPSAAQLLQHERIEFAKKISDTDKMLEVVKMHGANVTNRESQVRAREKALEEKERQISALLAQKDAEIATLAQQIQQQPAVDIDSIVREAVSRREDELRQLVVKQQEAVATAMARREEEIMASVNQREKEFFEAWSARERQIQEEHEAHNQWFQQRERELAAEVEQIATARAQLKDVTKGGRENAPLEEVKNILKSKDASSDSCVSPFPAIATPMPRGDRKLFNDYQPSAMKGVIMTTTGEMLSTPVATDLKSIFVKSPRVGLNFTNIFEAGEDHGSDSEDDAPLPPSPSSRKSRVQSQSRSSSRSQKSSDSASETSTPANSAAAAPTRIRRPSIRSQNSRPTPSKAATMPTSLSDPISLTSNVKPLPHPHLHSSANPIVARQIKRTQSTPEYDLADEENLPSPFLKRIERLSAANKPLTKRLSTGSNTLRAMAAANAAGRKGSSSAAEIPSSGSRATTSNGRQSKKA